MLDKVNKEKTMVELKNIKFIPKETQQTRKVSRTLHAALGSVEKHDAEQNEGLKFLDPLQVGRDKKSFKRGKHWYRVWRNKKTGRFAKKPKHGERAKQLGLKDYSRKTKTPKT